MPPLISIITINLNNAGGLERTIKSVASQSFRNYSYVVVDGNSKDHSKNVIIKNESSIDRWISEADSGIYDAMNKGAALADGEYLLYLNSGDLLIHRHVLKRVSKFLVDSTDIVYGDLIVQNQGGRLQRINYPPVLDKAFFLSSAMPHQASFIRRGFLFESGLYSLDYRIISDWAFFFHSICKKKCTYRYAGLPVSYYAAGGVSSRDENLDKMNRETALFFEKNPDLKKEIDGGLVTGTVPFPEVLFEWVRKLRISLTLHVYNIILNLFFIHLKK